MFFIVEAGARIQTPLDSLLDARSVQAVNATAAVRPVDEREPSVMTASRRAVDRAYHDTDEREERHRIKFAREVMSTPVVTGRVDQKVDEIWRLFADNHIHHLPLLDASGRLQGIVSDRDMMRFAANNNRRVANTLIAEQMTRQVITAAEQTEVRDLAEVMIRRSIGAIPVMDEAGLKLAGIVSRTDILRTLVHRAPIELWS